MKQIILTLGFIVLIVTGGCNQPQKERTIVNYKEIENVLDKQIAEWQKGNIDGFMQGYWHSDSMQFITKRGIQKGYDSVANNYKKHYDTPEKRGHLTFIDLVFHILDTEGEIVQCTGRWHIASQGNEPEKSGIFSLIFKNIKGEWKIIIDHTW